MRNSTLTALVTTATFLTFAGAFADAALAHGGSYRGPAGEVPPDSRPPTDPPPPSDPNPPQTPGGDGEGPGTGGDVGGGPGTGGGGGAGGGGGGGGNPPGTGGDGSSPGTGGIGMRGGAAGPGFDDWIYWWNFNKDELLALKAQMRSRSRLSSGGFHGIGRGADNRGGAIVRPAAAAIANEIVPALRELLATKDLHFDVRSAAGIALAKVPDEAAIEDLIDLTRTGSHAVVRESAALSLGLLQKNRADVVESLVQLLEDNQLDASFVRPFSAVSLGVLARQGDPDGRVGRALLEILAGKEKKGEVKPAALLALGMLGDGAHVPALLEMLDTGRAGKSKHGELSDTELSFVVQALGRIGAPGVEEAGKESVVIEAMTRLVSDKRRRRVPKNVTRSAAIALGRLAPACDAKAQRRIVVTLKNLARNNKRDASTRNFAAMALGRIGAGDVSEALRGEVLASLRLLLNKATPKTLAQPYAGLALGLIAHSLRDRPGLALEESIRRPLREKFDSTRNPRARGAYAIALGLAGDRIAVESLLEVLDDRGNEARLRGYVAVALGMIGDENARASITRALTDETDRGLRVQTAIAAGLIGDASVVKNLVGILETPQESQYVLGSVALALGQIGDERAIPPLIDISLDRQGSHPELTRALATVALGQICDQRDVPVLAEVAKDINYRAPVKSIIELLTIL